MSITTRGFSLIEVIIYLALFSILIGGAVVCTFNLLEAMASGGTRTMLAEETDFLFAKVSWALNDAESIPLPVAGATGHTLTVLRRDNSDGALVTFERNGTDLSTTHDGHSPLLLNNSNVKIEDITFTHTGGASSWDVDELRTVLTVSARTPNGLLLTRIATSTVYIHK